MSENFQGTAGVCGGTWWNPPKDGFTACSPAIGVGTTTPLGLQNCLEMKSAKLNHQQEGDSDSGSSTVTIDSTLQMMGFNFSSSGNSSSDWNPSILQEDMNSGMVGTSQDCQGLLQTGFPSSYNYSSSANDLITNLFDQSESSDSLSLLMNNNRSITNYFSPNELPSLSWPKPDLFSNQQEFGIDYPNSNVNAPFWSNSSTSALNKNATNNFVPSSQPALGTQFLQTQFQGKPISCPKTSAGSDVRDTKFVAKKLSDEPVNKKQRIATPSPLPTFKVRKENLRDQITALQQLVSPFGKTDTASVLQEAIEYIKFLHDQVNVLSTPYMKQGSSVQQASEKTTDQELGDNDQDLRSRGLCLVPISSTFPVANATTADFWTPSLGGNFR